MSWRMKALFLSLFAAALVVGVPVYLDHNSDEPGIDDRAITTD
jgi:hypothetical protein